MGRLNLRRSGPWVAVAGMVMLLWLVLASVLFAPWWGVLAYVVLWVAAGVLTLAMLRPYPRSSMVLPVLAMGVWFAIAVAGARWWGWSA